MSFGKSGVTGVLGAEHLNKYARRLLARTGFACMLLLASASHAALVSAVLPGSRSAVVGNTVTAFATIINAGTELATDCSIAPGTPVAADFFYQTTDPATNTLIGTPDTPVDIPAGGVQTFVIGFTPTSPFSATDVALDFDCTNTDPAATTVGLNTLLLSASSTPVPDIVALATTTSADGVVELARKLGVGAFAVSTVNLGTAAQITAAPDTGDAALPVTLVICETSPTTGACISNLGAEVDTQIGANATPTFAVFPTGTAPVDFDPGNKRVFVRFRDDSGEVRGSTSVAVKTLNVDVPFPGGGGLMLPEGSMPDDPAITFTAVAAPPLPDELEPLPGTMDVESHEQPTRPVEVRLPVPAGANADELMIYRYEDDGTLTLLGTTVDGNELVAGTPGFSRLGIARTPPGLNFSITGPRFLDLGEEAFYRLLANSDEYRVFTNSESYTVYGPLTIGEIDVWPTATDTVSITAGPSEGLGTIANEFSYSVLNKFGTSFPDNPVTYQGFMSINVSVQDLGGPPGPLAIRIYVATTTLYLGEDPGGTAAEVENLPTDATVQFRWRWDYGDTVNGERATGSAVDGHRTVIPGHHYTATGVYTVIVSAIALDANGAETGPLMETQFQVEVRNADDFFAWIEGPVLIDNPGDVALYRAETLGGTPEFDYRWQVLPGGEVVTGTTLLEALTFPRAGGAVVHLTVTDTEQREAKASLPVTVGGADPLLVSLAADPVEAGVGETVTATVTISGGVVIANGQEGKYQVTIVWGDGERSNTEVDPFGLPGLPGAPDTTVELTHPYSAEDVYYPVAYVTDVTGNEAESDPVTVVVGAANQDPVAADDAWSVWVEEAVNLPVLDNDLDPDGDPRFTLSVSAVGPPSSGGSASPAGQFVAYRPADNFVGIETFTYTVVDDKGGSDSAEVTIDVWPRSCDENRDPVTILYWLVDPPPYSGYSTVCEDDAGRRWIQAGIMREVISIVEGGELTDVGQAVDCWTEGEVVARIDEDTTTTYGGYLCPAE